MTQGRGDRVEDVPIGTWAGHRMLVSFGLRHYTDTRQTVEHEEVQQWWEFTAMGAVIERGIMSNAGQCVDRLDEITKPAPGWTLGDVYSLLHIWQRWHLNGMKAACAHQVGDVLVYWEDRWGEQRISVDTTCPVSGYRYGSAWLLDPLPDHVRVEVTRLLDVARKAQR